MKRRLRKKKRLGEFQELGFQIRAQLRDRIEDADFEALADRWIEAVEACLGYRTLRVDAELVRRELPAALALIREALCRRE